MFLRLPPGTKNYTVRCNLRIYVGRDEKKNPQLRMGDFKSTYLSLIGGYVFRNSETKKNESELD